MFNQKKIIYSFIVSVPIALFVWVALWNGVQSTGYQELLDTSNHRVIKIVLGENISVVSTFSEQGESLDQLMKKENWVSAVNWAYFCPADYWHCNQQNTTTADRVSQGVRSSKYKPDLGARWLFWFNIEWELLFILNNLGYVQWINKKYNADKIDEIYNWISNFPVLLVDGEDVVDLSKSLLDDKMKTKWTKTFICHNQDKTIVYMGQIFNKNIYETPTYMKDTFWCYNGINLDAGASMWMIYNNSAKNTPWRNIMDAFVVRENKPISKDLVNAVSRWYQKWLTIYKDPISFWYERTLRRDEAAKFFVQFAKTIGKIEYIQEGSACIFTDKDQWRKDLQQIIIESCKLWIFKGYNKTFNPTWNLTNAEAVTVLIRIIKWDEIEENTNHRSDNYYSSASTLELLTKVDMEEKESQATKWNTITIINQAFLLQSSK